MAAGGRVQGLDLIVIGTDKTGFIHGSVYGSASLALAATAACPVVVVPASTIADPDGVVVGADVSAAGAAALSFAAARAAIAGEVLTVVRVARPTGGHDGDVRLLSQLVARVSAEHPDMPVRTRHLEGAPAEVLVAASARARLLVLGDSRTGSSAPAVLGSVCHDALMNIRVPTAIVHGADRAAPGPVTQRAAWLRSVRALGAGGDESTAVPPIAPARARSARGVALRLARSVRNGPRDTGAVRW